MQHPQVLVAQHIDHPNIGILRHDDLYIDTTLACIHQRFPEQEPGKEIGCFNDNL